MLHSPLESWLQFQLAYPEYPQRIDCMDFLSGWFKRIWFPSSTNGWSLFPQRTVWGLISRRRSCAAIPASKECSLFVALACIIACSADRMDLPKQYKQLTIDLRLRTTGVAICFTHQTQHEHRRRAAPLFRQHMNTCVTYLRWHLLTIITSWLHARNQDTTSPDLIFAVWHETAVRGLTLWRERAEPRKIAILLCVSHVLIRTYEVPI